MLKITGRLYLDILMQGVSAKPVRVRSYWRVRNGRKDAYLAAERSEK